MLRKGSGIGSGLWFNWDGLPISAQTATRSDHRHAAPGNGESDDGERRRLVGAVGADILQIGAEGRTVEQARHGELADDDREGEERAGEHGDQHIGQNDPRNNCSPTRAEDLSRLGERAHIDGAQARVHRAVHVGKR